MKKLFIILCAALTVLPTFAGNNEKVVDKSGRQPKWVFSTGKDYITVSAEGADIQSAKDKAMTQVKKQILSSIAESVQSSSSINTREQGVNGKYNILEEYNNLVETKGALIPFLSEVSEAKVEEYYWEKLKRGKSYVYRYHIKYPFNQFDLMRLSDEFLTHEREINQKLDDFSKDNFTSYNSVEEMIQRVQEVRMLRASLMEQDPRRATCQNIEKVYNGYLKTIVIRQLSINRQQLVFAPFYGEKQLTTTIQPKLESNCLNDMQFVPQNGKCIVTYDYQTSCYDGEQNDITVTLNIAGNKVKNTFIVK